MTENVHLHMYSLW